MLDAFFGIEKAFTGFINFIIRQINFLIGAANVLGAGLDKIRQREGLLRITDAKGAGKELSSFFADSFAKNLEDDPTGRIKAGFKGLFNKATGFFDKFQLLPKADLSLLNNLAGGEKITKVDQKALETAKDDLQTLLATISPVIAALGELTDATKILDEAVLKELISEERKIEILEQVFREIIGVGNVELELKENIELVNAALDVQAITALEAAVALGKLKLESTEAFDAALGGVFPLIAATRQLAEVNQVVLEQTKGLAKAGISAAEAQKRLLREAMGLPPTLEQTNEQMAVLIKNQKLLGLSSRELQSELRKVRLEFLEGQKSAGAGFERGAIKVLEEFSDTAGLAEDAVVNAFKGMEDAIVEFVKTGKLNFTSLIDGITEDLTRLAVREAITGPLAELVFGKKVDPAEQGAMKIKEGIVEGSKEGAELFRQACLDIAKAQAGGLPGADNAFGGAFDIFLGELPDIFTNGAEMWGSNIDDAGFNFGSDIGDVFEASGQDFGNVLDISFNNGASLFESILSSITGGGGGITDILGGIFGGGGLLGGLLPFAKGGSFDVNRQSALATLPGAGQDNRVIAFRANDSEKVTVSQKGDTDGGNVINFGPITINGAGDPQQTARAVGREMKRQAEEAQRQLRRNG